MDAPEARRAWLDHLAECTLCPVDLCDKGMELAAEVRASLGEDETEELILQQMGLW